MSEVVPEGWISTDFGGLTSKIEGGGTPSRDVSGYWCGSIPWASVKDLTDTFLRSTKETITELGLKESSSKLVPKDTVILATRMAVGKAVIFNKDVAINQDLKAVYTKNNVDWRFLLQWYLSKSSYIETLGTGSTVKGIRLDDLKIIPVVLPPLLEQQKIASILTSVDEVIEKIDAQISKLQDLKKGMMQELLTKGIDHTEFKDSIVGKIPKEWEVMKLSEVVNVIDSLHLTPSFSSAGYPMVRVTDIKTGKINLKNAMKVNREVFAQYIKKYPPSIGDLLMSRVGSYGVCSYVNTNEKFCIGQNTVVINPKNIDSKFIYYSINSLSVQNQIENEVAGSGYKSLSLASIRALNIVIPSSREQKKISGLMWVMDDVIEGTQRKLIQIQYLKKALMQDLLTGEVRVKVN